MSKPIIGFHNIETDTFIQREMNDLEFADFQKDQALRLKAEAEAEAKATARQAILDRLGLTEEEAKLLLG